MTIGRFVPATFGTYETWTYRAVWLIHAISAFVIAYYTTNGEVHTWIQHWLHDSNFFPSLKVDSADSEWWFYKRNILRMLICLVIHSFIFKLYVHNHGTRKAQLALCAQFTLHIVMMSAPCVFVCTAVSATIIFLSYKIRSEAIAWVSCIAFIIQATKIAPFTYNSYVTYLEFNMYAYTCLKILNVTIYLVRTKAVITKELLIEILEYMLYLPFSITLIVLFDDFQRQMREKCKPKATQQDDLRNNVIFGLRLIFWFFVFDLLQHFIYVNAVYSSIETLLYGMNAYQLMSISYVAGQFFHMKYVVIFGVPALFAKLDGIKPPAPPICVSRVSRYAQMWRYFDAGLYQFLKNQVYIPLQKIGTGYLAILLRVLAMCGVFFIVLVWHGFDSQYIYWVTLSGVEIIIEWIGASIWQTKQFQKLRSTIGEKNTTRLIAVSMLFTVIPGISGVFCFLGARGIGTTVIRKVIFDGSVDIAKMNLKIVNGIPTPGFILTHLLILGYFFNLWTLELDRKVKLQ